MMRFLCQSNWANLVLIGFDWGFGTKGLGPGLDKKFKKE